MCKQYESLHWPAYLTRIPGDGAGLVQLDADLEPNSMELFGTAAGWPEGRSPWMGDVTSSPGVPEQARTGIGIVKNTLYIKAL